MRKCIPLPPRIALLMFQSLHVRRLFHIIKQKIYLLLFCGICIWKKLRKRGKHDLGEDVKNEDLVMMIDVAAPIKRNKVQDNLAKTQFPEFNLEGIPDGELTEVGNDEMDSVQQQQQQREEKYRTKEDQDVAVFLSLAQRMSLKSLLHLLEGQARAQSLSPEYLAKYSALAESESMRTKVQKPLAKHKCFRFAEVMDHQVRGVVHEVESWKDITELWWHPEEMQAIRSDLIQTVQFFRKHRPLYTKAMEIVVKATEPESVVEDHMRILTQDSYARGLESHIVSLFSGNRKDTVRAVLQEQSERLSSGDDYEMTSHCLREQSLAYSQLSAGFAGKMAQCDHIDALKALMSRWYASPPAVSSAF
jgi:hypothetical protein